MATMIKRAIWATVTSAKLEVRIRVTVKGLRGGSRGGIGKEMIYL